MNIKILDSWLREYIKTKATPQKLAEMLSLTSVSVEKLEKVDSDIAYDIEVTTNRPDLMSVIGIARETSAVLPHFGINATCILPNYSSNVAQTELRSDSSRRTRTITKEPIKIINNPKLVNRICAVVMEVTVKESPQKIKQRIEASGIRSLNNLIDVTNYVMREIGHPTHVFDYDRLHTKTFIIRESEKGEKITTLDKKEYTLTGGDIVLDNGKGKIVDLLGIMGTANSVVTNNTKRILFFIDNNKPWHVRKTSMSLGIRSEAAVLNEKGVDSELAMQALLDGIQLYQKVADAKIISPIIDIYPNKVKPHTITVSIEKINTIIGVTIPTTTSVKILTDLGFKAKQEKNSISVIVPSWRTNDIAIEEDIIEEIARVYGYHRLPSILPPLSTIENYHMNQSSFYWERRAKDALKYWGFTEVYTYSFVSENLLESPTDEAVELANPLTLDWVYMRKTLVPSLLQAVHENKNRDEIRLFEIANVYEKTANDLPAEIPMLAGILKKDNISFYDVKGIIEQLLVNLGVTKVTFKKRREGGDGADVYVGKEYLGNIEALQDTIVDFELNFAIILQRASLKKVYKPLVKFPPIIEDIRLVIDPARTYEEITLTIKNQSSLVVDVSLLDVFEDKKTFRITYQHPERNLSNEDIPEERKKIYSALEKELKAKIA